MIYRIIMTNLPIFYCGQISSTTVRKNIDCSIKLKVEFFKNYFTIQLVFKMDNSFLFHRLRN